MTGPRLAALLAVVALSAPAHAEAREASAAEVRALASRALEDRSALRELREVDRVDGRRVELGHALEGDPAAVRRRLRLLAERPGAGRARASRGQALAILREDRFHAPDIPRPLQGFFGWLGETVVRPIGEALEDVFDELAERVPGGRSVTAVLLAALVLGLVALLSGRALRPRRLRRERALARVALAHEPSAAELERAAERAEREGELDLAVRLRFRAGLMALQESGTLEGRSSLTTRQIARRLRSPDFERLAGDFEEIAYGGREAEAPDVEAQRQGWRRLLEEART